ncbi:LrgB-like family-domain-containing protein [Ochromonadaceae sp. CCMP2298]|nr:LrgB-like family-domain-containing protein [Ochromonadaceae sp. CCMP2298]
MSPRLRKIVHPIIVCAVYTVASLALLGVGLGVPVYSVLGAYFGSAAAAAGVGAGAGASVGVGVGAGAAAGAGMGALTSPITAAASTVASALSALVRVGSGDLISSLLGPAIICFGLQLYQYRAMLVQKAPVFVTSTLLSSIFGLLSSASLCRLTGLPRLLALSTLTRCITSPLALAGAALTGADPSPSALVVVLTGIVGASFGESILSAVGVEDPLSMGVSIGASAHGLGTAALTSHPYKFAAAVVSMTLTGLWTVALLSLPPARSVLTRLALGA